MHFPMKPTLLFALLLTLTTPAAFAKGPKEAKTKTLKDEETFKTLDKDGDHLLSKDEFSAIHPSGPDAKTRKKKQPTANASEDFEKLDTDKDGKLTLEEFSKREANPAKQEGNRKKKKLQE